METNEQQPTSRIPTWYEDYQLQRATAILTDQMEAEKSGSEAANESER